MEQFNQDISVLTSVSIQRALDAIQQHENAIFFIGRATCPYCRLFASKLARVVKEIQATVYFVNSQDITQTDLADFRSTYNIPTVPGFVRIINGKVDVRCDSSMTEQDIKSFIQA
ncbi:MULTISPECIES: thioredoxin domain-containing protein [unclassified Granulicatella]|uniref:conjugal transfer protein TraF n=1 Tax=unclassified Granulicatella TaxID=2630493 RepID=UPI001073470B|nr:MULTISPECIES: thioredoxin domain-containing protein [unclassified Granulicatella]MBF0780275.1 PedC/BrcD family bacteriocin maturation disulfide isomerase [Granulicatella sp. 19428wC4_WM01]TFU95611.1 thioredoxin [Granulicatella sp. WM01]